MTRTGEFAVTPQPYPARPRWAGDFHRLEASLFADRKVAQTRADDFAQAFMPGHARSRRNDADAITDRYLLTQLPDLPSIRIDVSLIDKL